MPCHTYDRRRNGGALFIHVIGRVPMVIGRYQGSSYDAINQYNSSSPATNIFLQRHRDRRVRPYHVQQFRRHVHTFLISHGRVAIQNGPYVRFQYPTKHVRATKRRNLQHITSILCTAARRPPRIVRFTTGLRHQLRNHFINPRGINSARVVLLTWYGRFIT